MSFTRSARFRRYHGALTLVLLLAGCVQPKAITGADHYHVILCPGIAGHDPLCHRLTEQIDDLPNTSAQLWDWTIVEWTGDPTGLRNLTDLPRNQRRAALLANQITAWRVTHPTDHLSLVGVSGGAGIVLFAAADLPDDFTLDRIVLISGAVSPDFDLAAASRHAQRGIFNYYSKGDSLVLNDGTRIHGTSDRKHVASCGYAGFNKPTNPAVAANLYQLEWKPEYKSLGNDAGHLGGLATVFAQRFILPLFTANTSPPEWKRSE